MAGMKLLRCSRKEKPNPDTVQRHVDPPKEAGGWVHEKKGLTAEAEYEFIQRLICSYFDGNAKQLCTPVNEQDAS
jgi:hypothetical protein